MSKDPHKRPDYRHWKKRTSQDYTRGREGGVLWSTSLKQSYVHKIQSCNSRTGEWVNPLAQLKTAVSLRGCLRLLPQAPCARLSSFFPCCRMSRNQHDLNTGWLTLMTVAVVEAGGLVSLLSPESFKALPLRNNALINCIAAYRVCT